MDAPPDKAGWHDWGSGQLPLTDAAKKRISLRCARCGVVKKPARNGRVWLYKVDGHWTSQRPDCRIMMAESSDGPTSV